MNTSSFSDEVIVVGEDKQVNQYSISEAKRMAYDAGLELIEVAKSTDGKSVCKIIDKGKWAYEQKKLQKIKKQHTPETKEMRFRPFTEEHDIETKVNHIKEFLSKKHIVKVSVWLKGREKSNKDLAYTKLLQILEKIGTVNQDKIKFAADNVSVLVHSI